MRPFYLYNGTPHTQKESLCKPIPQTLQCIRHIFHNTPFCNRNAHTCAHFCYKMVHCGIWDWCIVGCVQQVYWNRTQVASPSPTGDVSSTIPGTISHNAMCCLIVEPVQPTSAAGIHSAEALGPLLSRPCTSPYWTKLHGSIALVGGRRTKFCCSSGMEKN